MITDRLGSGLPRLGASELGASRVKDPGKAPSSDPNSFDRVLSESNRNSQGRDLKRGESNDPTPPRQTKDTEARSERAEPTDKPRSVRNKDESEADSGELEIASNAKMAVPMKSTGPSQKLRVMQEFMDSMESEFGIPPKRMLEAMTQQSDKDLLKPPEEAASQVISKLDLDPEEAERAQVMYMGMLGQMAQLEKPVASAALAATPDSMLSMNTMASQKELATKSTASVDPTMMNQRQRRVLLNESLDRLNQKFFMTGADGTQAVDRMNQLPEKVVSEPQMAPLEDVYHRQNIMPYMSENPMAFDPREVPMDGRPPMERPSAPPTVQPRQQDENDGAALLAQKLAALGLTAGAVGEAIKHDPQNRMALKVEAHQPGGSEVPTGLAIPQFNAEAPAMSEDMQGQSFDFRGKGNGSEMVKAAGKSGKSASEADEFFVQAPMPHHAAVSASPTDVDPAVAAGAVVVGGSAAAAAKGEGNPNIQQIMNQAQYMIKKGGGEATVRMNPEGLGQVQLKVQVQDGKVNLEMATETKEAKKILEGSIGDLKSSLGAHKLTVDSVKVDVGGMAADNQSSQDKSPQFKFDQSREQARQFLGQFHDENLGSRGGFFESTGFRAYQTPKSPDPLKAAPETSSRRRYTGEGKGSGLNLVA